MGEARRRREQARAYPWRWEEMGSLRLPDDAADIVILVEITCDCAKGGLVALAAGRQNGEWVIPEGFNHEFEIRRWLRLPPFPNLKPMSV